MLRLEYSCSSANPRSREIHSVVEMEAEEHDEGVEKRRSKEDTKEKTKRHTTVSHPSPQHP